MQATNKRVLKISSSGRIDGSVSRDLSDDLISAIEDRYGAIDIVHRETLAHSDALVAELRDADVLVIGVPMYNFSITAALKA